jgi:hypothetical protein
MVLFSAAPPGQGGEHHVNERTYEFWRGLFARHGYDRRGDAAGQPGQEAVTLILPAPMPPPPGLEPGDVLGVRIGGWVGRPRASRRPPS